MSISQNKYDTIDQVIIEEGLRITDVDIRVDIGKMLIFLNTNHIIIRPLSAYKSLKEAPLDKIKDFHIIANGTGVRWPGLDEDLSLKGFLKEMLSEMIRKNQQTEAA
jgi:hypothetical protein